MPFFRISIWGLCSVRQVIHRIILECGWHSKVQQKDGQGKCGPNGGKRDLVTKDKKKARTFNVFLGQFLMVSFALRPCRSLSLLWDWSKTCCEGRYFGGSWAQLIIQEATGPDRLHPRALREVANATGISWWLGQIPDWIIANVTPIFKEGKQRILVAFYPWESYRAKLLGVIASYTMDKAAANIPSGFTKSDSGAVDKEGEDGKCCTLWL